MLGELVDGVHRGVRASRRWRRWRRVGVALALASLLRRWRRVDSSDSEVLCRGLKVLSWPRRSQRCGGGDRTAMMDAGNN